MKVFPKKYKIECHSILFNWNICNASLFGNILFFMAETSLICALFERRISLKSFLWKLVSLFLATILSDFRKAVLRPLTSWIVAVQLEIHFPFLRQPLLFKKHTKEPEQYLFTKNTSCLCVTLFSKRTSVLYLIICGFQIAEREKGFQRCENLSASLLVQIFSPWREIFSLSLFCLLFLHCLF